MRVPWNDPVFLKRILDAGANGVMIPSVDTAEEAVAAVRAGRYPPGGRRGYAAPGVRNPLPGHHGFFVLLEAQAEDDRPFMALLEHLAETGVVTDAALAQTLADVGAFWATRDAAAEFRQVLGPHASYDIGLPVAAMDEIVYQTVRRHGGPISAEHGIGLKTNLAFTRSEAELALMRTIKRALDPGNLLNPGKVL